MSSVEVKKELPDGCSSITEEPHYPYGTQLRLENELLESLNLGTVAVGQEFMIRGIAVATSTSNYDDGEGVESCISLQFTMIEITPDNATDRVDRMYGDK
jgi:hypothetical protein